VKQHRLRRRLHGHARQLAQMISYKPGELEMQKLTSMHVVSPIFHKNTSYVSLMMFTAIMTEEEHRELYMKKHAQQRKHESKLPLEEQKCLKLKRSEAVWLSKGKPNICFLQYFSVY
jgi:hypothetical protein